MKRKHLLKYLFKWNLQNEIIIQQRPKQTCHWTLVWFTPKRRDFKKMVLYTWWNFVPTNTGLVKDGTTHTMCECAHQQRLVKNGAMQGVWVCTLTQTLSKMAYRHMGLCVWEHTNMDLETVIANELTHYGVWGLTLKPNRKLSPDHLPSIFHGVLVGAGSL
jgi:hypothetical protein